MANNKNIKEKITWDRMCELATKAIHKLLEDDYDAAIEFFEEELELEDFEREFIGVPAETEHEDRTEIKCENCLYYWKDEDEDYSCCHFDSTHHATPAPCEYDDYYAEYEECEWETEEEWG